MSAARVFDLGTTYLHLSDGPGALLIPRGSWHWARVREPSEMWFVTYGEGTQHRGR